MRNHLLTLAAAVVCGLTIIFVYVTGLAANDGIGPLLPRDPELVEVSPFAALLQASQRYRADSACATAEFFSSVDLNAAENRSRGLLERLVGHTAGECAVYSLAAQVTAAVFETIKSEGRLPQTPFAFSLFVYDPNLEGDYASFAEETIGLFANLESCERVEQTARDTHLPTRRCEPWTETALR